MDLVLLESLVAVADAGTITAASERIHVSQSALSRRLQQLETELGAELLVRGRHGVEPTEMGRQTVEHARRILARYHQLQRDIIEHLGLQQGAVRVGGGATVTSFLLPPAIAEFQAAHPGIHFYVKETGSLEIAADVVAGNLELGIVTMPVPTREVDVADLLVDEIVLVAARDHPLARRRITPADLEGERFIAFEPGSAIRQIIDARMRDAGVEPEVAMELRSIPSILRLVATTRSLAFVSRVSLGTEPDVRALRLQGLTITRTLGLVTRRGFPLSPPAEAFARVLRRSVASSLSRRIGRPAGTS